MIREGIIKSLNEFRWELQKPNALINVDTLVVLQGAFADEILQYLHSQGVVKRVKCPDCEWSQFGEESVGMTPCFSCNSIGYLIEEL